MVRTASALCIVLFMLHGGCTSPGQSKLSRALTTAVKEKKLSREKMENILSEYELLRQDNKEKAREYAERIVTAIEMGADSSHIDVVRKRVRGKVKEV